MLNVFKIRRIGRTVVGGYTSRQTGAIASRHLVSPHQQPVSTRIVWQQKVHYGVLTCEKREPLW